MLAINHATLGTTLTLSYCLYFNQPLFLPVLILIVFAAVLPDIDHPGSEIGRYFKPIGKLLPHRGITHSFLGVGLFYTIMNILFFQDNRYFTYFLLAGCVFGLIISQKILKNHILKIDDISLKLISAKQSLNLLKIANIILYACLILVLLLVWNNELRFQIFIFINIAYFSHLIGDFITIEGIPLFYPFKKKFGLKLFKTGGKIEAILGFLLFCSTIYLIYRYSQIYNILDWSYWSKYLTIK